MKLIATRSFEFAGRALGVGDVFDATERHGKVLKAAKRATDAPPPPPEPPAAKIRTRAMVAEPAPAPAVVEQVAAPMDTVTAEPIVPVPNRYSRRDMRAEGE